jgi:hypothetical protein
MEQDALAVRDSNLQYTYIETFEKWDKETEFPTDLLRKIFEFLIAHKF